MPKSRPNPPHPKTLHQHCGGWRYPLAAAICLLTLSAAVHAQWEIQHSNTHASLRGIHSLGGGVAWASGTDGTVLRTEDGGTLWQGCAIPPGAEKLDFRGIQAFDEQTAIVMSSGPGDQSRLYKTTDGCRSWKLVFTNPDKDGFWDVLVLDRRRTGSVGEGKQHASGFLLGDPVNGAFVLYTTIDAGQTWARWSDARANKPARASTGESLFAASNSAAVPTGGVQSLAFVTGGPGGSHFFLLEQHDILDRNRWSSFTRSRLPLPSRSTAGAFSIATRGVGYPDRGIDDFMIVGGDYAHPDATGSAVFLPARRYCCAWLIPQTVRRSATSPHGYRSAVAYDPTHSTWITVGPNGTDISRDDGKNWTALKPTANEPKDADQHWNALFLPFVVGPDGRIGKLRPDALGPAALSSRQGGAKP